MKAPNPPIATSPDPLVAGFLPQPERERFQIEALVSAVHRGGAAVAPHRQQVQMDLDQLAGVDGAEAQRASCGRIRLGAKSTVTLWRSAGSTLPDTSGSDWQAPAGS